MTIYAFEAGATTHDQDQMNSLISLDEFALVYEGAQVDAKAGAGVTENSIADYSYCAKFTLTDVTSLSRIELHLDKDGTGADVTVQIRSGMDPAAGTDGTLLKQITVPKEFISTTAGYWSIPIDLTGLTEDGEYWIAVVKAGDSTNKIAWIGEASQDGSYPAYYRAGTSGAWTLNNSLHFKIFSDEDSDVSDLIFHRFYTTDGYSTLVYDVNDLITAVYRYLPPASGAAGGIRDIITYTYANGRIKRGEGG